MADRSHLSIGEVLSLLQDDFPDVTISKIRFLESQGLLDPERTPSGYRKFYEGDIERLRWILRHQRDHFLPLKVMKDRLEEAAAAGLVVPPDEPPAAPPVGHAVAVRGLGRGRARRRPPRPRRRPPTATEAPARERTAPSGPGRAARPAPTMPDAARAAVGQPARRRPHRRELHARGARGGQRPVTQRQLGELTRYGLLAGHSVAGDTFYDGDALVVARTAAGFVRFGIEARHLRMYKVAAEREAGFMEQVVMPLLKQRNPTARQQAADNLGELAGLGEQLRSALLRGALRDHTDLR